MNARARERHMLPLNQFVIKDMTCSYERGEKESITYYKKGIYE